MTAKEIVDNIDEIDNPVIERLLELRIRLLVEQQVNKALKGTREYPDVTKHT